MTQALRFSSKWNSRYANITPPVMRERDVMETTIINVRPATLRKVLPLKV